MLRTEVPRHHRPDSLSVRERNVIALVVTDAVAVGAALAAAHTFRFGSGGDELYSLDISYVVFSVLLGVAWIVALAASGAYVTWPKRLEGPSYRSPVRATVKLVAILAVASLALQLDLSRAYLAFAIPIGLVVFGERVSARAVGGILLAVAGIVLLSL